MYGCKAIGTPLVTNEKYSKEDRLKKSNDPLYKSLIGSLLYLTAACPDIMYAISLLSRFTQEPSQIHYRAAKL